MSKEIRIEKYGPASSLAFHDAADHDPAAGRRHDAAPAAAVSDG